MKYSVEHDQINGLHLVRVVGNHKRPDDSLTLQNVARNIMNETGCAKILYDMRDAIITGGTMEIFSTAEAPLKANFERHFRIALVYSSNIEDHKFMETVVVNRGYQLRVFTDMGEAKLWLSKVGIST